MAHMTRIRADRHPHKGHPEKPSAAPRAHRAPDEPHEPPETTSPLAALLSLSDGLGKSLRAFGQGIDTIQQQGQGIKQGLIHDLAFWAPVTVAMWSSSNETAGESSNDRRERSPFGEFRGLVAMGYPVWSSLVIPVITMGGRASSRENAPFCTVWQGLDGLCFFRMLSSYRCATCCLWDKPRSGCAAALAVPPRKRAPPPPRRLAPGQCSEGTSQSRKGERVNLKPDLLKSRDHSVKGFEDSKAFSPGIDKLTKAAQVNQPSIRMANNQERGQKASFEERFGLSKSGFHVFIITFHVKHHNKNQNAQQAADPWTSARHG